ncbi:MAG: carbohydrate binding domain-containing protein, partial [Planctomycetota bacterium]|nr:carbohydrate binding domain-containing protein [Planctomycetota bacterium]
MINCAVSLLSVILLAAAPAPASDDPLAPWHPFWSREQGAGQAVVDKAVAHEGRPTIHIEHRGKEDWSLAAKSRIAVEPGDLFELSAWLKIDGDGRAEISAVTYAADGKTIDWSFGERSLQGPSDWRQVTTRLFIPAGVKEIGPRLIGHGPVTVWLDAYASKKTGNVLSMRPKDLPPQVAVSNAALEVTLSTADVTLSVKDKRTGQVWAQRPVR